MTNSELSNKFTDSAIRKNLREIARSLISDYPVHCGAISFSEFVKGIIYVCSLFSLSRSLNKSHPGIVNSFVVLEELFDQENDLLQLRFPNIYSSYHSLLNNMTRNASEKYLAWISKIYQEKMINGYELVSWFYQYMKKSKEKEVFRSSLNNGQKITGIDILPTTQFFTENYMVKYIVSNTLNEIRPKQMDLTKLHVIDPACGSGNFLMHAFDYLYGIYINSIDYDSQDIVHYLLDNTLIGYDLDYDLASIAKINLFIKACHHTIPNDNTTLKIFGGATSNELGFLQYKKENPLDITIYETEKNSPTNFADLIVQHSKRIIITNPPFMGIRNMSTNLKMYLQSEYPISNGDLCVSFIERCLNMLNDGEKLGLVNQTSWMYLKTFKKFRSYVFNNFHLEQCVDLGDNSFFDITGAKSNVALTVIAKRKSSKNSIFYYLRLLPLAVKENLLESGNVPSEDIFLANQQEFLENKNLEVQYLLSKSLRDKIERLPRYSEFANPMQGTSTGNNSEFIDYAWNRIGDKEWVLVSKGGGYCKWTGLNIYKVKWGNNAEYIKSNPGSAIRNLGKIPLTDLVYSDTGTQGMNVRILNKGQVFIASGPGIQVNKGNSLSHLAYLNSRVASFFMRILTPKLTISAGYIADLPVTKDILFSSKLAELADACVSKKASYLSRKLGNEEFLHDNYSSIESVSAYIEKAITDDLRNELERLKLEQEIERLIENAFDLTIDEVSLIRKVVANNAYCFKPRRLKFSIDDIDNSLAASMDVN
ncbi:Eco57I restriction-modification methylase domain-containing protein, partial [Chloroflexota bacterium]